MRGSGVGYVVASMVGLVLGAAMALGGGVVARVLPVRPEVTAEQCDTDPSLSGFQGWCVQRRHTEAGLLTDAVDQVWVVAIHDGSPLDRYTFVPIPAQDVDDPFEVAFAGDGIEVTLEGGVRLWLPAEYYAVS